MTDPLNLPEWVLDVERTRKDMLFGRIPLELVISQNQVAKVIGTKQTSTKFRSNDEAMLYALDYMRTKAKGTDGTTTFSFSHKKDRGITQIIEFDQIEMDYPI